MAAAVLARRPYCPAAGTTTASSLGTCSNTSRPTVPSPARYASLSSLEKEQHRNGSGVDLEPAAGSQSSIAPGARVQRSSREARPTSCCVTENIHTDIHCLVSRHWHATVVPLLEEVCAASQCWCSTESFLIGWMMVMILLKPTVMQLAASPGIYNQVIPALQEENNWS